MKVSARRKVQIVGAALMLAVLAGCQSIPVAKDAAKIELSFEWPANATCFGHSPAFKVGNVPKETKYLVFNMKDFNANFRHGGGTAEYTGGNTIPEGALKDYQGPCPPMGAKHTYQFTVQALNAQKNLILGEGVATRKFPE